jgi:tripartite ATP-independent transporter DctP family solute receptor
MKKFLLIAAIGALVGSFVASPAPAAEVTLKAGHNNTVTMPYHLGMVRFKERLAELTSNKGEIQIYPNAQLGDELAMLKQVLTDTLDMMVTAGSTLTRYVPEVKVFTLPFLFDSPDHLDAAMRNPEVSAALTKAAGPKGFRVISVFTAGVRHILNSEKPLFSIKDLQGMKIRVMPNPVHVAAFRAFGANPSPIDYGELYGALQTGVVDGAEAANSNYFGKKFYEVAPFWAQLGWLNIVAPVVMSEKKFQSLPKSMQDAILKAGIEAGEYQRQLYTDADKVNFQNLLKAGVKVTHMDPAPFREASKKVYDEFVKSDTEKGLLAAIKAAKPM